MDLNSALDFKTQKTWRKWLESHHQSTSEAWVVLYKKHVKQPGLRYPEAVDEAVCFGWIDSKMKRVDDDRFIQRFSPRRTGSIWSKANVERVERMIKAGKMTSAGFDTIAHAKESGQWARAYSSKESPKLPEDLKRALSHNKSAWKNFQAFSNSQQTMYLYWVLNAKRSETRIKRIKQVVERAAKNQKPG